MRWAALVLLLGAAVWAQPGVPEARAFWGVEAAGAGPVYFGLEGRGAFAGGPWEAYLSGRLRLGALAQAEGEAWVGVRALRRFRLRAGYGGWFATPPAEGYGWGARLEAGLGRGWGLAAAWSGVAGAGLGYRGGGFEAWLWARADGPAFYGRWTRGNWSLGGWYRSGYASPAPRRAGLVLGWGAGPWRAAAGWRSDLGAFLSGGWRGPVGFDVEGRWNPRGAALGRLRIDWSAAPGVGVRAALERSWQPFSAWAGRLELRVDAYAAPASQGE